MKMIPLTAFCLFTAFLPAKAQDDKDKQEQKPVVNQEQVDAWKKAEEERLHNDWANLARFRDDNTRIGLPAPNENRIVFMGNSITEGWSYANPAFFAGKPYVNRGISGQTTPQMLVRFRPDVIALKPKVVVILAGINDIAGNTGAMTLEQTEDNLASMADLAMANGIRVVLSAVLPAYDFPWRPGIQPAEKVVKLNEWLRKFAAEKGCGYIDYFTPMSDEKHALKAEYTTDGVHPNLAGYLVMEPLAEKAIHEALAR
jgi:lysophospholipase L1-like esterase